MSKSLLQRIVIFDQNAFDFATSISDLHTLVVLF